MPIPIAPSDFVKDVMPFIMPLLPYLVKGSKVAIDEAIKNVGGKVGKMITEKGVDFFKNLKSKVEDVGELQTSMQGVLQHPESTKRKEHLESGLEIWLEENQQILEEIHQQFVEAKGEGLNIDVAMEIGRVYGEVVGVDVGEITKISSNIDVNMKIDTVGKGGKVKGAVISKIDSNTTRSAKGNQPEKVFFSYSHKDTDLVEKYEKVIRSSGNDILRDSISLRSGQKWNARLLELIEEADVFLLFWSHNAAKSKYVEQEWRHALNLRRENFIRPIFWEDPMPQVPDDLSDIHFDGFDASTFEK